MSIKAIPRRIIHLYDKEFSDIANALFSGRLISGNKVEEFEEAFAEYLGVKKFFALSSGRAALKIILETLDYPQESEIIIPAYTASEVPSTVINLGLKTVFVDIKSSDHNMDPDLIEEKITDKTKAIIATHLFGFPCDLGRIIEIARKHNLDIIEDCAHAIGASYKSTIVGNYGKASFFSFANTKPFNTFGGGGIAVNDGLFLEKVAKRTRALHVPTRTRILKSVLISYFLYFLTRPLFFTIFVYPFLLIFDLLAQKEDVARKAYAGLFKRALRSVSVEARISNAQALVGMKQLLAYRSYCAETSPKFDLLKSHLVNVQYLKVDTPHASPVPYYFVIVTKARKKVVRCLLRNGIDTGNALMRLCPKMFNDAQRYWNAEEAFEHSLQVPLHGFVHNDRILQISKLVNECLL